MTGDIEVDHLSMKDLDRLMTAVLRERVARLIRDNDPQHLIVKGLNDGFSGSGDPTSPIGFPGGFVVIMSSVKDVSATKRQSILHTVRMSEEDPGEWWTWDESSPSFVDSETVKVGNYRKTASVHMLSTDALVIRHHITWKNDDRDRTSVKGYQVKHHFTDAGEITDTVFAPLSSNVLRRLPPPPDSESRL